ncbi:hypothetical protein D9757_012484 [Collybiopsis confluens]|uniref:Uncharacterized protein n=1 Tax=Collybiopsis confluens TaxID=2823264 RepID=A0A8H5LPJ8_9AGAR|nr:hypothetical protein D9757_012484 [Collybiopsis confluens]
MTLQCNSHNSTTMQQLQHCRMRMQKPISGVIFQMTLFQLPQLLKKMPYELQLVTAFLKSSLELLQT